MFAYPLYTIEITLDTGIYRYRSTVLYTQPTHGIQLLRYSPKLRPETTPKVYLLSTIKLQVFQVNNDHFHANLAMKNDTSEPFRNFDYNVIQSVPNQSGWNLC